MNGERLIEEFVEADLGDVSAESTHPRHGATPSEILSSGWLKATARLFWRAPGKTRAFRSSPPRSPRF